MSQREKEEKWADQLPAFDEEEEEDAPERPYRDGSAVNECWNPDREQI